MKYVIDTNLLVRLANIKDPKHAVAIAAIQHLQGARLQVFLVPQVIYEFWVVSTRPLANNGLGETPLAADQAIGSWCSLFPLLGDEPDIFPVWIDLVRRYSVIGKPAHDARLVAAMIKHKIDRLLTFNDADFKRYTEITAVSPLSLNVP